MLPRPPKLALALLAAFVVGVLWWSLPDSPETGPPGPGEFDRTALFVTNRDASRAASPAARFGGARGELVHGQCRVRFSPIPGADGLAERVAFFIPTRIRDILATETLAPEAFREAVDARAGEDRPVVVYVHGYSYGFGRACRMGAEFGRMLEGQAAVILFTWPSDANPADYVADQVDMEWSVPELAGLLRDLRLRYGTERIKLLAHSLGSRGVLFALSRLARDGEALPLVDHLVLLAPDFDAGAFRRDFPRLRPLAQRITLYASDTDAPLAVSSALHGHPRLGQAGEALTVLPGMETIDVTPLGRYHPSGHEYFYYHPVVASDLVALLTGKPRDLEPRSAGGERYWTLSGRPGAASEAEAGARASALR